MAIVARCIVLLWVVHSAQPFIHSDHTTLPNAVSTAGVTDAGEPTSTARNHRPYLRPTKWTIGELPLPPGFAPEEEKNYHPLDWNDFRKGIVQDPTPSSDEFTTKNSGGSHSIPHHDTTGDETFHKSDDVYIKSEVLKPRKDMKVTGAKSKGSSGDAPNGDGHAGLDVTLAVLVSACWIVRQM